MREVKGWNEPWRERFSRVSLETLLLRHEMKGHLQWWVVEFQDVSFWCVSDEFLKAIKACRSTRSVGRREWEREKRERRRRRESREEAAIAIVGVTEEEEEERERERVK